MPLDNIKEDFLQHWLYKDADVMRMHYEHILSRNPKLTDQCHINLLNGLITLGNSLNPKESSDKIAVKLINDEEACSLEPCTQVMASFKQDDNDNPSLIFPYLSRVNLQQIADTFYLVEDTGYMIYGKSQPLSGEASNPKEFTKDNINLDFINNYKNYFQLIEQDPNLLTNDPAIFTNSERLINLINYSATQIIIQELSTEKDAIKKSLYQGYFLSKLASYEAENLEKVEVTTEIITYKALSSTNPDRALAYQALMTVSNDYSQLRAKVNETGLQKNAGRNTTHLAKVINRTNLWSICHDFLNSKDLSRVGNPSTEALVKTHQYSANLFTATNIQGLKFYSLDQTLPAYKQLLSISEKNYHNAKLLAAQLKAGEIWPASPSNCIRSILCQLLEIETPAIFLDQTSAKNVDQEILRRLAEFNPYNYSLLPSSSATLYYQSGETNHLTTCPETTGKPLTIRALLHLIEHWRQNHSYFSEVKYIYRAARNFEAMPSVIQSLINITNQLCEKNKFADYDVEITDVDTLTTLKELSKHYSGEPFAASSCEKKSVTRLVLQKISETSTLGFFTEKVPADSGKLSLSDLLSLLKPIISKPEPSSLLFNQPNTLPFKFKQRFIHLKTIVKNAELQKEDILIIETIFHDLAQYWRDHNLFQDLDSYSVPDELLKLAEKIGEFWFGKDSNEDSNKGKVYSRALLFYPEQVHKVVLNTPVKFSVSDKFSCISYVVENGCLIELSLLLNGYCAFGDFDLSNVLSQNDFSKSIPNFSVSNNNVFDFVVSNEESILSLCKRFPFAKKAFLEAFLKRNSNEENNLQDWNAIKPLIKLLEENICLMQPKVSGFFSTKYDYSVIAKQYQNYIKKLSQQENTAIYKLTINDKKLDTLLVTPKGQKEFEQLKKNLKTIKEFIKDLTINNTATGDKAMLKVWQQSFDIELDQQPPMRPK